MFTDEAKPYVIHDTGSFTMVPLWIIEKAGYRALKLYCLMGAKYGQFVGGNYESIYPSIRRLASDMECSEMSIRRALSELVEIGAIKIEPRTELSGRQTSNQYTLISIKLKSGESLTYKPINAHKNG